MNISIPLEQMTKLEKIAVMEKLWDDLCRDAKSIPSPAWHRDILEEREKEIKEGNAEFIPFGLVKERIRNQTK
jgi:putative addiction module component (TIGR02574 family)